MPENGFPESRAISRTRSPARDSDAVRCLGIVLMAAAAGTVLAGLVLSSGGGFLGALLSYSLGASIFVLAAAGWLLVRELRPARLLRAAWARPADRLRRLAS